MSINAALIKATIPDCVPYAMKHPKKPTPPIIWNIPNRSFFINIIGIGLGELKSNEKSFSQAPHDIFGRGFIGEGLTALQAGQFQVFIFYQIV